MVRNDPLKSDTLLSTKPSGNKTGQPPATLSSDDETESRMRQALGLRGAAGTAGHAPQQRADQARARHKFVQDGGVPVVMLNRGGDQDALGTARARIAELEHQLETERAAHNATRRSLNEAQVIVQGLQTRIAHAELAHHDALAASTRALEAAQAKSAAPDPVHSPVRAPRKPAIDRMPKEQKPVRWWTPSYNVKGR